MINRNLVLSLAGLAIGVMLSFATTPASAGCGIHQGGECGQDAVFRPGEPRWGSRINTYVDRNQHRHRNVGRQYDRRGATNANRSRSTNTMTRSQTVTRQTFVVRTGTIAVYRGTCMVSRITGEVRC